jgi:hypothetical protein
VNEGQAFALVAAATYACIELTRIRLQFTRLREFFEDQGVDR